MEREIWKKVKIKGFNHYRVSNLGRVKNTRTDYITKGYVYKITLSRGPLLMISLYNKGNTVLIPAHKLVFSHFKSSQLKNYLVWHNDLNGTNNKETNLSDVTLGDLLRKSHAEIKRKRGVYSWTDGIRKRFRAVVKVDNKSVTLGYTKKRVDAELLYKFGYEMIYGSKPY